MADDRKTMGAFETLWAIIGGLLLAGMIGLGEEAKTILIVAVLFLASYALYWKLRVANQRRQRQRRQA